MANAFHAIAPESGACSSSSEKRFYDVFINHRGPDVKHTLAAAIYRMLDRQGVRAFLDDKELELGDPIPQVLQEAILNASAHIAIFSPGYAESPWCLEELLLMLQTNAPIIPVFYCVDPSHLRYVAYGNYASAFDQHRKKRRYAIEKIEEWEKALNRVSYLSGSILDAHNCDEEKLREIVDAVRQKIKMQKVPLEVATFPVGLEAAVQDFESKVGSSTGSENVRIVGIAGMGGSGKTTLAKELCNRKSSSIRGSSFLSSVRDEKNTLHKLQRKLLKDLRVQHSEFHDIHQGAGMLAAHVRSITVLIVLDDVDDVDQIHALLPHKMMDNLGHGSFIIVTTRDKDVLTSWGISSIYQMNPLDAFNARQLFCRHAFSHNNHTFEDLIDRFVKACNGLPLSLKVFGAMVNGKSKERWEHQLLQISRILPDKIADRLQLSYDALNREQRQMFLDIACFFIGAQKSLVVSIWDGSGWSGELGLETLVSKCLVELDEEGNIAMHDHLRDLGRDIATKDDSTSRMWREEQISSPGGGSLIRGIVTPTGEEYSFDLCDSSYRGRIPLSLEHCMENLIKRPSIPTLKLLVVNGNDFREEFAPLSRGLVWLRRYNFNGSNLPSWLSLATLSVLELYRPENLEELWQDNKQLPLQLRELIIEKDSFHWTSSVSFRGLPSSIGRLTHLKKIVLDGGYQCVMRSLPEEFCQLRSLECLELSCIRWLSSLPDDFGNLRNLRTLRLRSLGLRALPDSFKQLTALQSLHIVLCKSLVFTSEMLHVLEFMTDLQSLEFWACPQLEELPHLTNQVSLRKLSVSGMKLRELPNLGQVTKLETLVIYQTKMCKIAISVDCCLSLETLRLRRNRNLREIETLPGNGRIGGLPKLKWLELLYCPALEVLPRPPVGCKTTTLACPKAASLFQDLEIDFD